MFKWAKQVLYVLASSCAHIPGTDVPIPDDPHEGYRLAACLPLEERDQACCYYAKRRESRAVCTVDGGDTWVLMEPEEAEQAEPGPDLSL